MIDYFCEWIQKIAYYMILVTLVMQAAAGEGYRKYIRLFTGIILILFLLSPVIQLFGLDGEAFVLPEESGYEAAAKRLEEKIQELAEEGAALSGVDAAGEAGGQGRMGAEAGNAGEREETGKIEVGEIQIGR